MQSLKKINYQLIFWRERKKRVHLCLPWRGAGAGAGATSQGEICSRDVSLVAASPPLDPPDPVVGVRVNPDPDLFRIMLELESDGFPDPDTEPTDFLFFALATVVAVETKLCARLLFTEK